MLPLSRDLPVVSCHCR